jgi:hypothetical protein
MDEGKVGAPFEYSHVEMCDFLDSRSCNHIALAMPGLSMVHVDTTTTTTTGHMNGLLIPLSGFSNCVLHTYSWLHNGQR